MKTVKSMDPNNVGLGQIHGNEFLNRVRVVNRVRVRVRVRVR